MVFNGFLLKLMPKNLQKLKTFDLTQTHKKYFTNDQNCKKKNNKMATPYIKDC
jgi:hypothetical protein